MLDDEEREVAEIAQWFIDQGFALHLSREEHDLVWAELARLPSGKIVAPMYGRGSSELEAARRARERFGQEQ